MLLWAVTILSRFGVDIIVVVVLVNVVVTVKTPVYLICDVFAILTDFNFSTSS